MNKYAIIFMHINLLINYFFIFKKKISNYFLNFIFINILYTTKLFQI